MPCPYAMLGEQGGLRVWRGGQEAGGFEALAAYAPRVASEGGLVLRQQAGVGAVSA